MKKGNANTCYNSEMLYLLSYFWLVYLDELTLSVWFWR